MKKIKHDNFVGIYDGFFSEQFCDNLVAYYEWCKKHNRTFGRVEQEKFKKDDSCGMNPSCIEEIDFAHPDMCGFINEFNNVFWDECYKDYIEKYSVLSDYDQHTVFFYKVQKTLPGGGYHLWHSEDGSKGYARRIGVYLLYLNDVEEGGETEFLYFSQRIKPKKGTLLIFPPNYPWAHRGNPPLSNEKYIMTGWIEYS